MKENIMQPTKDICNATRMVQHSSQCLGPPNLMSCGSLLGQQRSLEIVAHLARNMEPSKQLDTRVGVTQASEIAASIRNA
jgi:hypothetical protein